jgi:hypothetical protein
MTTIHNPSQFNPQDYSVIDYIDAGEIASIWFGYNQLASSLREMGEISSDQIRAAYAAAQADEKICRDKYERYFGVRTCPTQCQHCGTGRARYFAVALHQPTNKHIAVGHICADHRLGITLDQYKFDRLKERAAAIRTEQKRDAALAKLAETDAELADAIDSANRDGRFEAAAITREQLALGLTAESPADELAAVAQNFTRGIRLLADICASIRHRDYAASEKQRAVILSGLDKSREFAALSLARVRDSKAVTATVADLPALTGRITITGTVVSSKHISNDYGTVTKYLIRLADGRKTFGSLPADLAVTYTRNAAGSLEMSFNPIQIGQQVEFVATVEQSERDAAFYFHSRPTLTKAAKAALKAAQA